MNLDFVTFRHNLFTSSHLNMFCNSETIVFCISTAFCPKESSVELSVVSSAYKIKLSSSVNNPHQLTEFQTIRRLRPCHHLLKQKHPTIPCLSMEDITLGGHHARGSLDSCIMPNEHF